MNGRRIVIGRGWAVVAICAVLALLCACSGALPDPNAVVGLPTARATVAQPAPATLAGPDVPVSGRVVTSRGLPIEGAVVTLRQSAEPRCGRCGLQTATRSDGTGAFRLVVPEETYLLACTTPAELVCRLTPSASLEQGLLQVRGPIDDLVLSALPAHRARGR